MIESLDDAQGGDWGTKWNGDQRGKKATTLWSRPSFKPRFKFNGFSHGIWKGPPTRSKNKLTINILPIAFNCVSKKKRQLNNSNFVIDPKSVWCTIMSPVRLVNPYIESLVVCLSSIEALIKIPSKVFSSVQKLTFKMLASFTMDRYNINQSPVIYCST